MNAPVESFLPFYFGSPEEQLYATYHASPVGMNRRSAILLCYPLGSEYMYAHRSFRQLAIRSNRIGFPVMRFDYYGSGDSARNDTDGTLTRWLKNIAMAIEELKRRSGASTVCLAGLRLGASLAVQAALNRQDISGLVLWEPIINGKNYLAELQEEHQRRLWYLSSPPDANESKLITEVHGFALSEAMITDLQDLDLLTVSRKPSTEIFVTEKIALPPVQGFLTHLSGLGSHVKYQEIDGPTLWSEDPDKALVPHQVLQAIVTWMGENLV